MIERIEDRRGNMYNIGIYHPSTNIFKHNPQEVSQVKNLVKICEESKKRDFKIPKSELTKSHIQDYIENELERLYLVKKTDGKLIATTGFKTLDQKHDNYFITDFNFLHPKFKSKELLVKLADFIQDVEINMGRFGGVYTRTVDGDLETKKVLQNIGFQNQEGFYFRPNK